jgi:type IV pilus assembly protein PilA
MLARIRKAKEENEGGFTLIELLVVVVIIGILAAIAIPTFLNQREKAWEKAVVSDLRNAAVKQEEKFSEGTGYYADKAALTAATKLSDQVTVTNATSSPTAYCMQFQHAALKDGTGAAIQFRLDSANGKPEKGAVCP